MSGTLGNHNAVVHGLARTKQQHSLYRIWAGIKTRCYNPNVRNFHRYGGRGIVMCAEWIDDPVAFIHWGLTHGWKPGLTIDRKDNDGPYSPDNCQFITRDEQAANRRDTIRLTWHDETLHLAGWAEKLGMSRGTLHDRYKRGVRPPELFAAVTDTRFQVGHK